MDIRHSENMKHHTNADLPKQRNDQYENPVLVFLPQIPLQLKATQPMLIALELQPMFMTKNLSALPK